MKKQIFTLVGCFILMSCVSFEKKDTPDASAATYQEKNVGLTISKIDLYDMCSKDIDKFNFPDTSCGLYLQGAVGSYISSLYMSLIMFLADEKSLVSQKNAKELIFRLSGCTDTTGSSNVRLVTDKLFNTRNIAKGLIDQISQEIDDKKNIEHTKINLDDSHSIVWNYLFTCGTGEEFSIETYKNIKGE